MNDKRAAHIIEYLDIPKYFIRVKFIILAETGYCIIRGQCHPVLGGKENVIVKVPDQKY